MTRSPVRFRYAFAVLAIVGAALAGAGWWSGWSGDWFGRAGPEWTDAAERLQTAATHLLRRATDRILGMPTGLVRGAIFVAGFALGWAAAMWWIGRHHARRPLLIADLRGADMPLAEGVRHVRVHAFPPVEDDGDAVTLLLREAVRGRLTLWRKRPDALRRVSPLGLRAAIARIRLSSSIEHWTATNGSGLMLLGTEVERLWPSRHAIGRDADAPRIINAA